MKITVILCTYNRCQRLATALESVAASELPAFVEWEVLVVDNTPAIKRARLCRPFATATPGFQLVSETQQGKSYALNRGFREAQGEVLAFMDDDVIVEPTWLRNLTGALRDGEWVGVGGRILPEKSFTPPPWLALNWPFNLGGVLALFELGEKPGKLEVPPFGTTWLSTKSCFNSTLTFAQI